MKKPAAALISYLSRALPLCALAALLAGCATTTESAWGPAEVSVASDRVTISFPGTPALELTLALENGEVIGLAGLTVGGNDILEPLPEGARAPMMKVIESGHIEPVADIVAYLEERAEIGDPRTYPARGSLVMAEHPVRGPMTGWRREGQAVVIGLELPRGRAEWIFAPASTSTYGGDYFGLSWQLRLYDVGRTYEVTMQEPVCFQDGDWRFQQRGNQSKSRAEEEFQLRYPFPEELHAITTRNYSARQQPFFFLAGSRGATLSFFDRVSRSDVGELQEGDRVVVRSVIPVRPDDEGCITTPVKSWVFRPADLSDKWQALNEWTWAWDRVVGDLQALMDVAATDPLPILFHQQFDTPGLEYGLDAAKRHEMDPPSLEDSWLVAFADDIVPKAAVWGIGLIELRAVLDVDLDHPESDYLPGSFAGGSVCSPWGLRISPKLGGEAGLAYLVEKAHEHDIRVTIWSTPAHQSVCSPIVRAHPEWLMMDEEGRVNNRGYTTLVGMDLAAGYRAYMEAAYQQLRDETGVDGVWADSYCAFGADRDMSDPYPYPQLHEAIALQSAMQKMGYSILLKEGCGPFGLSTRSSGLHDILGREYLRYYFLYNHSATDRRYDPDSYFRSLASKGVMEIRVPQEFEAQPEENRRRMVQVNHAYNQVRPLMKRRYLVGESETWQGVAWVDEAARSRVLYSFEAFDWIVPKGATVRELMTGQTLSVPDGILRTEPWRVYLYN